MAVLSHRGFIARSERSERRAYLILQKEIWFLSIFMYCFFSADAITHRTCARFLYRGGFFVSALGFGVFSCITIGTNWDIRDISGYYEQLSSENLSRAMNCLYFIRKSDRSFQCVVKLCRCFALLYFHFVRCRGLLTIVLGNRLKENW